MSINKKSGTAQIYRTHEDTNRLMIEVALDNYEDMFNEWDPAPFKRRDIDPDLRTFLEQCSDEISLKHPIAIALFLPKGEVDPEKQEKCIEGLHNFFKFNHYLSIKELRVSLKNALKYFLFGAAFLAIAVTFEYLFEKTVLFGILGQGLFIGGWVFLWEALTLLAFKNAELRHNIREWERFLDAPVVFKKERRPQQGFE
ncbi:MAG: hypothetical protein UY04_C0028G0007 [Parcubacteria group bacterium GW2011_GWA2_47_7]|nr:MAG: hypothetical protein UY04_C0028G0007 [Parcubacteria group bacterium GW2011_GWA2_47_7]